MNRKIALSAASGLVVASLVAGVPGATPAGGTLAPEPGLVAWAGSFDPGHLITPSPELRCLEGACDTFALTVALGDGYWATRAGAVEVAIRWPYDGITDLDLIVRDAAGKELARSAAVDSNAESVFLPEPDDGTYEVVAVPTNTVNPDAEPAPVAYEGMAQVEITPTGGAGIDLKPNLISLPPKNFHVATALNLVPFPENPVLSCYPEETIERPDHPTRCLRFDQTIANVGDGPLELRFEMTGVASPDPADQRLVQRIYRDDGSYRDAQADSYELHAVHGHVHYKGFGQSFLFPYEWAVGRTGGGTPARTGNKVGFCVIDVLLLDGSWGATGNGPRTRTFPNCNVPTETNDGGVWMVQGINIGWADVYGWNLAGQYIDITGLSNGVFELEQVANATGSVEEISTLDNRASTIVCIAGDSVTEVTSADEAAACPTAAT